MSRIDETRLQRALRSLDGLTLGDQFGELFFLEVTQFEDLVGNRKVPEQAWHYTDDTEMALSVVLNLRQHGKIDQDSLMHSFALRHDMTRGYGPSMRRVLSDVREGAAWRTTIAGTFEGQGSWGNGSAMRAGPIGAYFADDLPACIEQSQLSSLATHTHPEAVAGALAVAVSAALACHDSKPSPAEFILAVADYIPDSEVRSRLLRASRLAPGTSPVHAGHMLGNGSEISAPDTVPFAVWCAAQHLGDYEEALWNAVSAGGDRDTICAIVGSIVAMSSRTTLPANWMSLMEPYPQWFREAL
ncbi:ADP-ribosylglycohydrolase family protein [Deinococcus radiotolerans]|uniref:ADP-ribosylglycohydrolase family protein n=1 Tax=Deinococcus radiotolerans TaxID=1309407 RepID=UPI001E2F64D7|nr:ADP-ribosylglycohydrolase family protein [Deinococcus radiotolerans]